MKRTYTPSIEEIDRQHGERYYTVTLTRDGAPIDTALQYGTLDDIISMMDCTLQSIDPEAVGDEYGARISYGARTLIVMPDLMGPDSAQVAPQPVGDTYEVREIDALAEYDDPDDPDEVPAWIWNDSYHLGTFTTTSDPARALRRYLKTRHGITFYRGCTVTEYDGDVYEICDRATHEPLFAAIPCGE